jgi:hypothetical protein
VQGPYFLQLLSFEFDRPAGKTSDGNVVIFQRGSNAEVARLSDVKGVTGMSLAYGTVGTVLAYDQRILFIPDANVLIHIPADRTKIMLRRLNVQEELEKSGQEYLVIASEPPATAKKGQNYAYQMAVKSKHNDISYRVESGPPGMTVTKSGMVTWQVPADFDGPDVDVIIGIRSGSGKEQFQSFRITLQ